MSLLELIVSEEQLFCVQNSRRNDLNQNDS